MAVERPAGYNPAPSDPMSDAPEIEVEAAIGEEVIENPDGQQDLTCTKLLQIISVHVFLNLLIFMLIRQVFILVE